MSFAFTSPPGRFVQGDLFEAQTKDQQGAPRVIKTGPNAGQPNPTFFVALAIPKTEPGFPAFWSGIVQEAATTWPAYFPNGPQPHILPGQPNAGGCIHPRFAFKVKDGDGTDSNGKSNATKEGFAGHWIVSFSSTFPVKVFPAGRYDEIDRIHKDQAHLARRGYYLRIAGSAKKNDNEQNPGLYMNFALAEVVGTGPEISSGPDAAAAFGGTPVALPAGATALPGLPAPGGGGARVMLPAAGGATYEAMIQAGWTDATLVANGMMAAPVAAPPMPPPAPIAPPAPPAPPVPQAPPAPPVTPYAGYMAPPAAPPAPPVAPPAPPAPPQRVMLPAAGGATYEAMIQAGWTDATLVANGMMAA